MTETTPESSDGGRRWLTRFLIGGLAVVVAGLVVLAFRVTGAPDRAPEATGTPEPIAVSPFAGTPAEDFAEGAAGIVLPPAEPVGDFTAEQVADALEQVRRALIAARLDHTMLIDHDPEPFIALLAHDQEANIRAAFDAARSGAFATQVASDSALVTAAPRVAGEISYRAATTVRDIRIIEVVTRFAWVYGFEVPDDGLGVSLVVIEDELVWIVPHPDDVLESSRGLSLPDATLHAWGIDCDAYDDGLLRPGLGETADLSEALAAAFDPRRPLAAAESC